jgi:hypothetical protein
VIIALAKSSKVPPADLNTSSEPVFYSLSEYHMPPEIQSLGLLANELITPIDPKSQLLGDLINQN